MKVYKQEDRMSRLIINEPNLLSVISRFGIKLGFKDQTIAEVCKKYTVNVDFFLAIANTYINEAYFPENKLLSFSPVLLVDYLKRTHQYYISYAIPRIELLLMKVVEGSEEKDDNLTMINSFYKQFKNELLLHLEKEEKETFPYVVYLENNKAYPENQKNTNNYGQEHTDVETKLSDLKNLIIKYLEPRYNVDDMNDFLHALYHFEQDLNDHARIEDVILLKQVSELESKVNQQNA